ncbi:hypothetical protein GCM10009536_25270 [Streptomyces thermocarboxydus]
MAGGSYTAFPFMERALPCSSAHGTARLSRFRSRDGGSHRSPAGRTARGAAPRQPRPTRPATPPRTPGRTVTEASMFRDACDGARTAYRALVTTVTNR